MVGDETLSTVRKNRGNPSLADQVYERILAKIASDEYPMHSKLPTEAELCAEFDVSRAVVRKALMWLRDDEVVSTSRGSGSYVCRQPHPKVFEFAPLSSVSDLQRCYEFRIAVESEAAYLAAMKRSDAQMQAILRALAALNEVIARSMLGVEEDYHLHMRIAESTNNHFFAEIVQTLRNSVTAGMVVTRKLSIARSEEHVALVQKEHQDIVAAILEQEPERARNAMRQHLKNARHRLYDGVDNDASGEAATVRIDYKNETASAASR